MRLEWQSQQLCVALFITPLLLSNLALKGCHLSPLCRRIRMRRPGQSKSAPVSSVVSEGLQLYCGHLVGDGVALALQLRYMLGVSMFDR